MHDLVKPFPNLDALWASCFGVGSVRKCRPASLTLKLMNRIVLFCLLLFALFTEANAAEVYGRVNHGCIADAAVLPAEGEGYISIRRQRERYYAHPQTIALIHRATSSLHELHPQKRILIGDLSQYLGGKMPRNHASHQNGLDFDVWFYMQPQDSLPSPKLEPASLVDRGKGIMYHERWNIAYRDALQLFALSAKTDRIFVNPVIKQYLCRTESDRTWLRKLRPWWGHDAHFHVRLHCPPDSPQCSEQAAVPPGDGCDESLDQWVVEQSERMLHPERFTTAPKKKIKAKAQPLPDACIQLFQKSEKLNVHSRS